MATTWGVLGLAVVATWAMLAYNRLVRLRNQTRTAWADIDVQLQRRHDLVPRLVTVVQGYAAHERATLEAVTALRAQAQAVHAFIRSKVAGVDAVVAANLVIQYGGSVKAANAAQLFSMPDIDGGLIGGASLSADEFVAICRAAQQGV